MERYKSIRKMGTATVEVEKSEFIAYAKPVLSEEEAFGFISEIRGRYRDATHVVTSLTVGRNDEVQRYDDDGEPKGSSGPPILAMIKAEKIKNVSVAVVRYFGGTKLGTGGLVRAYTSAAKAALLDGGIGEVKEFACFTATIDYTSHGKIGNFIDGDERISLEGTEFTDKVTLSLKCESIDAQEVIGVLTDLLSGNVVFSEIELKEGF